MPSAPWYDVLPDPVINERAFQRQVIALAKRHGWLVFHPLTSQKRGAWSTFQLGHKGFPDLVLAHPASGVIFAELKSQKGKVSADQEHWRAVLEEAGAKYRLWRPRDWPTLKAELAHHPAGAAL